VFLACYVVLLKIISVILFLDAWIWLSCIEAASPEPDIANNLKPIFVILLLIKVFIFECDDWVEFVCDTSLDTLFQVVQLLGNVRQKTSSASAVRPVSTRVKIETGLQ